MTVGQTPQPDFTARMRAIHEEANDFLVEFRRHFKNAKLTLVVRMVDIPNADIVITEDDLTKVAATLLSQRVKEVSH